jgi:hypothetical protein
LNLQDKKPGALFFGDWHGDINYALRSLERAYKKFPDIDVFYHVGDFGVWPGSDYYLDSVALSLSAEGKTMVVTGGNHENWNQWDVWTQGTKPFKYLGYDLILLPKLWSWTHAGKTFTSVGGAHSIDRSFRTPNLSWWPQESISYGTVNTVLNASDEYKADVLITHESSHNPVDPIKKILADPIKQAAWPQEDIRDSDIQQQYVSLVLEAVAPTTHVHGHWHIPFKRNENGLHTVSLGDNSSSYAENSWLMEW